MNNATNEVERLAERDRAQTGIGRIAKYQNKR